MTSGGRDLGLDAARGVALLSMFIAHFAPTAGPANVLTLSEHLTAFLFVLLIGCGAELGRGSANRWRSSQIRAAALVVLGLLLMQLPTAIVVVLVWLGLMTVLAGWLSQLPSYGVGLVGVVGAAVSPPLRDWGRDWLAGAHDPISRAAVDLTFAHEIYRLSAFVAPVCAGVLLVRFARSTRLRIAVAAVGALVAVGMFVGDKVGVAELVPYSGTLQEIVFNTALALTVACVTWELAPRLPGVGRMLAAAGGLALTIYGLQVVGDWAYFKQGGTSDDQWWIVAVSSVGALLLATLWMPVHRATGWRGPLEGPIDALARGHWPQAGA